MIKAVLFDFFGVLTEGGREGAIRQVFAKAYHVDPDTLRFEDIGLDALKGVITDLVFIDTMNRRHPHAGMVTPADFRTAVDSLEPSKPVYALAEALRAHGVRTAILSNLLNLAASGLRARGLYDGFDPVLLSCEVGMAKPEEEVYKLALKQLACAPHEVLFVDDQEVFLEPARAMGMHVILAETPGQIVRDAKALIRKENGLGL